MILSVGDSEGDYFYPASFYPKREGQIYVDENGFVRISFGSKTSSELDTLFKNRISTLIDGDSSYASVNLGVHGMSDAASTVAEWEAFSTLMA